MELVKAIKGRILIRLKVGRWGGVREGFLEHVHLEDSAREGQMKRENHRKCPLGRETLVCTGLWGRRESGSFEEPQKENQVVLVGDQSLRGGPRHETGEAKGQASESKWEEVQPRLSLPPCSAHIRLLPEQRPWCHAPRRPARIRKSEMGTITSSTSL